ncbi:hypothetical protein EVAR_69673_1 [Eumeta japonica]|uniref:Uncharacterized protein n=1 Tax=Eumeta variegata TaxID=151549 RepID=A0A4C1T7I9_EUMVA|nr:hypothetical protein EVAR_69673_1 [Eumeta japonica]
MYNADNEGRPVSLFRLARLALDSARCRGYIRRPDFLYQFGELIQQFTCRLCAAAFSLLLGRIAKWNGRKIGTSQAERSGQSCLSIARPALSLARSAQAERDNESCFFVRAAGVHR